MHTFNVKPPADIAKMIESQPNLAALIRRVRGGYLKIQGTWMPYEVSGRCLLPRCQTRVSPTNNYIDNECSLSGRSQAFKKVLISRMSSC